MSSSTHAGPAPHWRIALEPHAVADDHRPQAAVNDHSPSGGIGAVTALQAYKSAIPRIPLKMVRRPRLEDLLAKGAEGPVTLICAGPGTGKTLAAAAWAGGGRAYGPIAWLTLERSDNDAATFWFDILTTLRTSGALPEASPLRDLIPTTRFRVPEIDMVRAALNDLPAPVALVLDDLQEITDDKVLDGIGRLLDHVPPPLHLILITRTDPRLRLHRLRVSGELTEIRTADLAFDAAEADELFATHGLVLTSAQRDTLLARTEGWAAGLRLAAMSLDPDELDRGVREFSGSQRPVADYLIGEVLDRQPTEVNGFLLRTSIASQLTGPLANALTDRTDGRRVLERVADENALVVAAGPHREWFRYHTLLRELLVHQLMANDPELVPELHRRAAAWFAGNHNPVDAIRHAALAGDTALVGRILVTTALPQITSPRAPTLGALLEPLATGAAAESSWESLACAVAYHYHRHDYAAMRADVARARPLLDTAPEDLKTALDIVLTLGELVDARVHGDPADMINRTEHILRLLETASGRALPAAAQYGVLALGNLGVAQLWIGEREKAERHLSAAAAQAARLGLELPYLNALAHIAVLHAARGDLHDAAERAGTAVRIAQRRGWVSEPQLVGAFLALAVVHYQRDEPEQAARNLARGLAASRGNIDQAANVALRIIGVRLLARRGEPDKALAAARRLRDELTARGTVPEVLERWMRAAEAEALLVAGDPDAVLSRWPNLAALNEGERVCAARAYLALGQPAKATRMVLPLLAEPGPGLVAAVEGWLIAALAADRLRRDGQAIEAVDRALALAEPEGVTRPFRTLGPRVIDLVRRQQRMIATSQRLAADLLSTPDSAAHMPRPAPLTEPLTDRELTVLRYLPSMTSNDEIGADLHITVNTVKAHLKALYRKLEVNNRREAVHRARDLGLLWPVANAGPRR